MTQYSVTRNGRGVVSDAAKTGTPSRAAAHCGGDDTGEALAVSKLTVHAVPVAQPRQRHAVVGGHIRNYTPKTHPVNAYKAAVMAAAAEAGITPMDGPVVVEVRFYLPRPKRLMRKKDPVGPIPHTAKPDVDNLWKSTADALSGLAWRDDSQVCRTKAAKFYAEKDGTPRVEIVIAAMEEAV